MADKNDNTVDEEIELELDVYFNEFDDLAPEGNQKDAEHLQAKHEEEKIIHGQDENSTKCDEEFDTIFELSHENELKINLATSNTVFTDEEEGELLCSEEEMDLETDVYRNPQNSPILTETASVFAQQESENNNNELDNNIVTELKSPQDCTPTQKEGLKRKVDSQSSVFDEAEDIMDVDVCDNGTTSSGQKKCKTMEINDSSAKVCEDESTSTRKKTRGGRKKKGKYKVEREHRHDFKWQQEMKIRPIIGRLFRPLTATEDDVPEVIAGQFADRLEESKTDLILGVVKHIGNKKAIELFQETKRIQIEGGMSTSIGHRRRTSGGIFLHVLKSGQYATKEQLEKIFADEKRKAKELLKKKQQEEKELKDLRKTLDEKRQSLLKL